MSDEITHEAPFIEILGDSVKTKVLFFFFLHPFQDYNKSEIAKYTGVSRRSLYPMLETLVKYEIVKETRKEGNAWYYSMNRKSPAFKSLVDFNNDLIDKAVALDSKKWDHNNAEAVFHQNDDGSYIAYAEIEGDRFELEYPKIVDVAKMLGDFIEKAQEALGIEHVHMGSKTDEKIMRETMRINH